jgi:WD40 repeat protein
VLIGHSDLIQTLYSYDTNDEDILVSGSCDTTIKLWNTTTMKLINTLTGHTGCINALSSFNYFNSNYLMSGSSDSKVKIWNHQISNQSLFELKSNHTDSIQALAYNDRYNYLAVGSKDKTFSLWKG